MKDETKGWLDYADENLRSAKLLFDNELFNPCLQNVQQAIEKMLKAVLVESAIKLKKTHSINELVRILSESSLNVDMTEDERDLLDSIYLPSKYPLGSILPDFEPDLQTCRKCVALAERVWDSVTSLLS
ncbi:MAG: HEPN domain-containing protein [Planctomycetes bacterium]|nr:HEPN domain-containing protein [Planctomycetota bacterium]MCH8119925.1 HEPN domain-containing protein [Planctomycetota bacterium]